MNRRNYQKELDEILSALPKDGAPPHLLLHSCCAPCSSYVLFYLSSYFRITDLYYNPNITEEAEYERRAAELSRLIGEAPAKYPVTFVKGAYDPAVFFEAVRGLEGEPEGGARCEVCFRLRLHETAKYAKQLHADYFTTTLSISPLKDAVLLNRIGEETAEAWGVSYLPSDFKKRGGYQRSCELSREYGLYRQDYCGCVFSKQAREASKTAAQ